MIDRKTTKIAADDDDVAEDIAFIDQAKQACGLDAGLYLLGNPLRVDRQQAANDLLAHIIFEPPQKVFPAGLAKGGHLSFANLQHGRDYSQFRQPGVIVTDTEHRF